MPQQTFDEIYQKRVDQERAAHQAKYGNPDLSDQWLNDMKNEILSNQMTKRAEDLSNPNSGYYRDVNKSIRNNLSGAMGTDSLLALTVAMGGSPAQAQKQIQAQQAKIIDQAGQLTNQYYLGAQSQVSGIQNSLLQNQQQNANRYAQEISDHNASQGSLLNSGLSALGGIGGFLLGGPLGGMIGSGLGSLFGGKGSSRSNYGTTNQQNGGYMGNLA